MSGFVTFGGRRPVRKGPSAGQRGSIWTALKHRLFLWLMIASFVSNVGTWMQNVGAAWLMTSLAPSALMVALVQTASSLPILALALPAGALADIVDRRRLLLFSQGWMLIAAALLGALTIAGATTPWSLLALSLALGVGSALNAPAWQAIVPELVPHEEITAGVSVSSIGFNAARAVGPALGGAVVAWAGAGATFVLNAASFLAVMAVLYEWERPKAANVLPAERVIGAIRAGIRYIRYAPQLQAVLVRTAAFVVGGSAVWAILPLFARWQLGLGPAGFGGLLGCFGGGAMVAGTALPRMGQGWTRDSIVAGAAACFAITMGVLAPTRNLALACIILAIAGGSWTLALTTLNVATQLSVPIWVQGRALAAYQVVVQGGMAGGAALWGYVAERAGLPITLACAGATVALGLLTQHRFRLATDMELSLEPLLRPAPVIAGQIDPESGPVLVSVEYLIDPKKIGEFSEAVRALRATRLRDGAVFWGCFFDAAQPGRFLEHFVVESWAEHVRQHERAVMGDLAASELVRSFHIGKNPPLVTHEVSAQRIESVLSFHRSADDNNQAAQRSESTS